MLVLLKKTEQLLTCDLKKKKAYNRKKLIVAASVSIPAFLYSLWAIIGLGYEIIIWGMILLIAGIPIYIFSKSMNK